MRNKGAAWVLALALVATTAAAQEVETTWKPGKGFKMSTEDGNNVLQIGGRVQARYTYEDFDSMREIEDVSDFTAQRVRIFAKGYVFKNWKYKFQGDWGKGKSSLKDATVTYAGNDAANFSMGQFKVHFDQQDYISSGKQTFVDRSLATGEFGLSRDVGVMLHGNTPNEVVEYNVGVFTGEETKGSNENDGHLVVAGIRFHPNGAFGYSESDIEATDEHLWFISIAAAWNSDLWDDDGDGKAQTDELMDVTSYVAGFGYRHGGAYLQGEYYIREEDSGDVEVMDVDSEGFYFQFGYMLQPNKWEIACRYSEIDPDDDVHHDEETEITLGVNRFFWDVGHSLKLTGDVSLLTEEDGEGVEYDDLRVRLQAQIVF